VQKGEGEELHLKKSFKKMHQKHGIKKDKR